MRRRRPLFLDDGWVHMTLSLLADHLLNLLAPAAVVSLLLAALARPLAGFLGAKQTVAQAWYAQAAINFIVGAAVLLLGLVLLGHDGKMLTYLALVLAVALSQWLQLGVWRRQQPARPAAGRVRVG